MALNNFHTPGPQTDVRNLMLAQLNQSGLANNIFNSALGEMNKFDTGARNLNTQRLTRDIANMSLGELENYYNNGKTALDILNEKDGTGFMYNETDPNLLNMINQRDNDYKTAKNNIVFNELQQLTPQQIIDSGNLFDKFEYLDKLTPQQQAWLTAAKGSAQKTLRTQALNELSPEEIADAATIGNIKLAPEYGSFNSQDAEYFRTLQGKYRGELDSKNYSLAMQLLNSIPNPLDRARLVNNPSEFKARLEQAGIKFRNGETFTRLMSDLGATYNDPTKKAELDNIKENRLMLEIEDSITSGESLPDAISIISNAKDSFGNSLSLKKQKEFVGTLLDSGNYLMDYIEDVSSEIPEIKSLLDNLNDYSLNDLDRATAKDALLKYGDKLFENIPLNLKEVFKNKYESTINSMLNTSNETSKVQLKAKQQEAINRLQSLTNNNVIGSNTLNSIINNKYHSKIPANEADEVKDGIKNMLREEGLLEGRNFDDIFSYLESDSNTSFSNYIYDQLYKYYKDIYAKNISDDSDGKVKSKSFNDIVDYYKTLDSNEKSSFMNNVSVELQKIGKMLPYIRTLDEAHSRLGNYTNIRYNGD